MIDTRRVSNSTTPSLSFLDDGYEPSKTNPLLKGLTSDVGSTVWIIEGLATPIDFNVLLSDGSKLTDYRNSIILSSIKTWLLMQGADSVTNIPYKTNVRTRRLTLVLKQADFILQHIPISRLRRDGFAAISESFYSMLVYRVNNYNSDDDIYYNWTERFSTLVKCKIEENTKELDNGGLYPDCVEQSDLDLASYTCDLTKSQARSARIFFHHERRQLSSTKRSFPNYSARELSRSIFLNCLFKGSKFSCPPEFDIQPLKKKKSINRVPTRTNRNTPSTQTISRHLSCFKDILELGRFDLPTPIETFETDRAQLISDESTITGNFSSIPYLLVISALKEAISYVSRYADGLFEACLEYYQECGDLTPIDLTCQQRLPACIPASLSELGITRWKTPNWECREAQNAQEKSELYWHIKILYGSFELILGALTARRQEELIRITRQDIDILSEQIIFQNGKSGEGDIRQPLPCPIPKICVDIFAKLIKFHSNIETLGLCCKNRSLLSPPYTKTLGIKKYFGSVVYNDALDKLCLKFNYTNNEGQIYLFREHQFRRFFAQMFFWGGFGDMEALRQFLGHSNYRHLFHYITDTVSGDTINSVKAEVLAEITRRGDLTYLPLARLIEKKFGTSNIRVIQEAELRPYLNYLISRNQITTDPVFSMSNNNESFTIITAVKHA